MGSSRHGFVPPQFALKHKEFAHLREVKMFPNALNPHKEEARALVRAMIDRVMELHRDLRWFHIGCDEVRRGPGRCCESRAGVDASAPEWSPGPCLGGIQGPGNTS